MVSEHTKQWDQALPQDVFAYGIWYGMHPRGIYGLRDLRKEEIRSGDVENFVVAIHSLHEQVRR